MHQLLHEQTRRDGGKQPSPRVAIIDSQSVKTNELATTRGFDGYKKVRRRKRHLVTDMTSTPLMVRVTDANASYNQIVIELQIVERTFSWFGWFRRLTLDNERYPKTAETMVYIAYFLDAKPNQTTLQTGSELDFVQKYNGWVVRKAVQRQTRRRESSERIASAIEILFQPYQLSNK